LHCIAGLGGEEWKGRGWRQAWEGYKREDGWVHVFSIVHNAIVARGQKELLILLFKINFHSLCILFRFKMRFLLVPLLAFASSVAAVGSMVVLNNSTSTIYAWPVGSTIGDRQTVVSGNSRSILEDGLILTDTYRRPVPRTATSRRQVRRHRYQNHQRPRWTIQRRAATSVFVQSRGKDGVV
jgi:hypothetical protein